jgi:predicted  nucleic acid-binding Zn-ribbon protein
MLLDHPLTLLLVSVALGIGSLTAVWLQTLQLRRREARLPAATALEGVEERLRLQQEDLAGLRSEAERVSRELGAARADRDTITSEAEFWRGKVHGFQQEWEGLESRRRELEELKAALVKMQEDSALAQRELQETRAALDAGLRQQRDAEQAAEAARAATERAGTARQEAEDALRRLSQRIATAQSDLERMVQNGERLKAELREAERQRSEALSEAERLKREIADLRQQHQALASAKASLEVDVAVAQTTLDRTRAASEQERTQAVEDLVRAPACLDPATRWKETLRVRDEKDALERVQRALERAGLTFPRRVLHAFHTCLKIADISPLTVLAGISGTGKSELPRRYAEALGIHFLALPVQPRWDSPQDLLGFYNYLEHRYRATELARLMVHMDVANWPDQAKGNEDRLALVLLDEMNLARVEYYFSEFLSRLEMRRADAGQVQQAAIELELGPSQGPAHRIARVYPSPNILFVGTMNEDESTQTLSDKVVDRASVLRFGRPRRIADAPAPREPARAEGYLSAATWAGWRREASSDVLRTLRERIERLNGLMDRAGRPFGFRLIQAIEAYVGNHPDAMSGSAGPNVAFADVLDLRVFPKLRGLDTESDTGREALDGIAALIEELGDEPLMAAFRQGRERELFAWPGVARDEG